MKWLLLTGGAIAAGLGAFLWSRAASASNAGYEPDYAPVPGQKSGYRRIDAILPKLRAAAAAANQPLGLHVGWIAGESGGRLGETTSMDERGYYQFTPDNSKEFGFDHQRLSTDPDYSIASGVTAINHYASVVDSYGVAPRGTAYFWKLAKLIHTVGSGETKQLINAAKAAGHAGSWQDFKDYALSGAVKVKHSPKKWFTFIDDKVYKIGRPFGFGSDSEAMVGADFGLDPETLARVVEAHSGSGSVEEKQAVAWVYRNQVACGIPLEVVDAAPSDESRAVAHAVCKLPQSADPTDGAVDYFCPAEQDYLSCLGCVDTSSDVRMAYAMVGLRSVGVVGTLELIG